MKTVPGENRITQARVLKLGEDGGDDLSSSTTPEQRIEMVGLLSRRMWELTGKPAPQYERRDMPGLVRRGHD